MPGETPVVVYPPSETGGRRVRADGTILVTAYSLHDLAVFLQHAGLDGWDDLDVAGSDSIEWPEGGRAVRGHLRHGGAQARLRDLAADLGTGRGQTRRMASPARPSTSPHSSSPRTMRTSTRKLGTTTVRLATFLQAVSTEPAPASPRFFDDVAAFEPAAEVYDASSAVRDMSGTGWQGPEWLVRPYPRWAWTPHAERY
ncbi:hypothetical protein AB0O68_35815 [Streptomyces sp. NPDC087512]|uniref:hypothetical protein n=1 Tax=Streptomyces sp. NPDC087512 TaxID=3155059 RepID=UPI0034388AD2